MAADIAANESDEITEPGIDGLDPLPTREVVDVAVARAGIPVIDRLPQVEGILNYLAPLWDSRNQAWHDKIINTLVVQA